MLAPSLLLVALPLAPASPAQSAREDVSYESAGATLAATILLPAGEGPFPGAVLVHGSGASDRSNPWTAAWAEALVARGVAVLNPDQRGAGDSSGAWRTATMPELADDALAGVLILGEHAQVDAARVGMIGFSQGGHVVPVAAADGSGVAFVVDVSGAVVPLAEQIADELRGMGAREGLDEETLSEVLALQRLGLDFARTGEGFERYTAALAALRAGPHGRSELIGGFPTADNDPAWTFLRAAGDFDPLPYWKRVRVPTLFVYGGRDENVDVFKSARIVEEQLTATELPYGLLLFRQNGHALFREDALDLIARWIHDDGAH
jgi:dipeptidyl aminopeptidase/acylaminoacyl peptidase